MNLWQSSYQLVTTASLNAKVPSRYRRGVVLRCRFDDGLVGYGDLCPFPEMGDKSIEHELRAISRFKPEKIGERSLYFCRMDAVARLENRSLYVPEIKIKNHFLISDIHKFEPDRIRDIEKQGFSEFKIKLGRDLISETRQLFELTKHLSETSHLRLDLNSAVPRDVFVNWFSSHQSWLRPRLDFIEDPFPFDSVEWTKIRQRFNIRFALDLAADPLEIVSGEAFDVIVIKPAVQNSKKIIDKWMDSKKKFVFTHYMDFPIGQMFALIEAQIAQPLLQDRLLTCGLQQNDLYSEFSFQKSVRQEGPFIFPTDGFGVGFDQLLDALVWQEVF